MDSDFEETGQEITSNCRKFFLTRSKLAETYKSRLDENSASIDNSASIVDRIDPGSKQVNRLIKELATINDLDLHMIRQLLKISEQIDKMKLQRKFQTWSVSSSYSVQTPSTCQTPDPDTSTPDICRTAGPSFGNCPDFRQSYPKHRTLQTPMRMQAAYNSLLNLDDCHDDVFHLDVEDGRKKRSKSPLIQDYWKNNTHPDGEIKLQVPTITLRVSPPSGDQMDSISSLSRNFLAQNKCFRFDPTTAGLSSDDLENRSASDKVLDDPVVTVCLSNVENPDPPEKTQDVPIKIESGYNTIENPVPSEVSKDESDGPTQDSIGSVVERKNESSGKPLQERQIISKPSLPKKERLAVPVKSYKKTIERTESQKMMGTSVTSQGNGVRAKTLNFQEKATKPAVTSSLKRTTAPSTFQRKDLLGPEHAEKSKFESKRGDISLTSGGKRNSFETNGKDADAVKMSPDKHGIRTEAKIQFSNNSDAAMEMLI